MPNLPSLTIDFFDAYGKPIPGLFWTDIECNLSYIKPDQKFSIVFPKKQTNLPDRMQACVKVFGVPYIYGYSYESESTLAKDKGSKVKMHFGNLCHMLDLSTVDPRINLVQGCTIQVMLDLVLAKFKQYNPFIQFSIAQTNLDIAIQAKTGGKKKTKRTLQKVAADDLQVRGGEKIAQWINMILNKSGLHLKEYCDASGLPVLDIDLAKNISTDFSAPDYILFDSDISYLAGTTNPGNGNPQPITIVDKTEHIEEAEMPFCIVGLGNTYGAATPKNASMRCIIPNEFTDPLLTAAEAGDWKIISTITKTVPSLPRQTSETIGSTTGFALGMVVAPPVPLLNTTFASIGANIGAGIGAQVGGYLNTVANIDEQVSYQVTTYPTQGEPDPYLGNWAVKFVGLQNYFPEIVISADAPNESCLIQKMTLLMRSKQFNAYSLDYVLHQPTGSEVPILPDTYVQVTDDQGKPIVYWCSDIKLSLSKKKGLVQHICLKIPNTLYLPDSANLPVENALGQGSPALPAPEPSPSLI